MVEFVIDTVGDLGNQNEDLQTKDSVEDSSTSSLVADLLQEYKESLLKANESKGSTVKIKSKVEEILTKEILTDLKTTAKNKPRRKPKKDDVSDLITSSESVQEALQKSLVLKPEFEQLSSVVQYSDKKLKELRKRDREKTKGKKWYGLPATELTEEVKRDLEIIQMRSVLDPKHFYKKNDLNVLPKYFQVGKVMDSPLDYYNNRLTKKDRKKTLVDELLADAEFSKYNKRKYKEIIEEKQKTHYKEWRKAKRLKKRK